MIFDITRLTDVAGQDFTNPKCRVRSPHITARDSIEIGDYIVTQQERIAELENEVVKANMKLIDCALDIAELEEGRITLLSCLLGISNECIGEIAMNYRLDAQMIGESIYAATGKTNPELAKALKEQVNG